MSSANGGSPEKLEKETNHEFVQSMLVVLSMTYICTLRIINCSLNLIEEISMAYIDVDKDIRYYTDRLEEKLDDKQDEINTLMDDVDGLRVTIQELVVVTNRHDVKLLSLSDKIDSTVVCIKTLNEMVEMISKRVGLHDESE